jgi:hypothetical protein
MFSSYPMRAGYSYQDKQAEEVVLAEGTSVNVVTTEEISSKTAGLGDAVNFKVEEDVVVNGHVVIRKDAAAKGSVINAEKSGNMGKAGRLAIQIESTQTVDGLPLKLRTARAREGNSKTLSTALLSGVVPLFALRKGSEAKVAAGSHFTVYVAEVRYFRVDDSTLVTIYPPGSLAGASARTATPAIGAEGFAIVYIYRPGKFVGWILEPSVYCDTIELARMDNGRYLTLKLPPGKHVLHMTDTNKGYAMEMEPGQTYYFRVRIVSGTWKGEGKLSLEDAEKAVREIKKLKFIGPDKIRDHTMVVELSPDQPKP